MHSMKIDISEKKKKKIDVSQEKKGHLKKNI